MESILLHACCGPCSIEPLRLLSQSEAKVALAFVNPNIHPEAEYRLRLDTLSEYASGIGCALIIDDYDPEQWEREAVVFGGPYPRISTADDYQRNLLLRQKRCAACYRLRFSRTAALAVANGANIIGSTLTISPYQFTQLIIAQLDEAARSCGLNAARDDYRPLFPVATRRSRELGMYRQKYCGCHYSEIEAELERQARKKQRKQNQKVRASSDTSVADGNLIECKADDSLDGADNPVGTE